MQLVWGLGLDHRAATPPSLTRTEQETVTGTLALHPCVSSALSWLCSPRDAQPFMPPPTHDVPGLTFVVARRSVPISIPLSECLIPLFHGLREGAASEQGDTKRGEGGKGRKRARMGFWGAVGP